MAGMVRLGGTQPTVVGGDETVVKQPAINLNFQQLAGYLKANKAGTGDAYLTSIGVDPAAAKAQAAAQPATFSSLVQAAKGVIGNSSASTVPANTPSVATSTPASSSTGLINSAVGTTASAPATQASTMAVTNPTITQASNPFTATTTAAPAPAPAASTTNTSATTAAPAPAPQTIAAAMGTAASYNPSTRTLDETNGTAAGRVDSILAKGGPLMERARALAVQQAQSRGLINSTMAAEAGTAAMIDRATPLAQQDADAYNKVDSDNQSAQNTAAQYNASEVNRFGLQASDQGFQASQQANAQSFQNSQLDKTQAFQADQADTDREIAVQRFNVEQENAFKQQAQANANTMQQMNLQSSLTNSTLPAQTVSNLMQQQQTNIGAILGDANLTPDAKKNAIANLVAVTNQSVAFYEQIFNTQLPRYQVPT